MIFVCTGTQVYQFDRLLKEVDRLVEEGIIKDKVFAQTGASTYIPKNYEFKPFLSFDEFKEYQDKASLVITHGGTGALVSASKLGKNIVAVPRLVKYGEHTDDHQLQIIDVMEKEGYIRAVKDIAELGEVVGNSIKSPISKKYRRKSKIISIIVEYIQNETSKEMRM